MALSASEKQKLYRERKKKQDFLESDLLVKRTLEATSEWETAGDLLPLLSDLYDMGKERLVQKVCVLIIEFAAVRSAAYGVLGDYVGPDRRRPGHEQQV